MAGAFKQTYSKEQALQKLAHYCAYQERCHQEAREKLYSLGMHRADVDEIISTLIEQNYLNEERFAIQFAGGKFRMNHWGRIKIKYALKQKQVSDYCTRKALAQIDPNDYMQTLEKLATSKLELLKNESNPFLKKRKLQDYLLQKGFEAELVRDVIG